MPPGVPSRRFDFLDGLRGVAILLMVVNHTLRWWLDVEMGWTRYYLAYLTMAVGAPLFFFLVGFCLPISFRRHREAPPFLSTIRRHVRRGVELVLANALLNLLVFPKDPLWVGGALQMIGLSVLLVAPLMWIARHRWAQYGILAVAAVIYLSFAWAFPTVTAWQARLPLVSEVMFRDYPPWPWVAAPLVGLVFGWWWLDARARGPEAEARYFTSAAIAAVACLGAATLWDWWMATSPRIGFPRDFRLNAHWTPRGATNLWIVGDLAGLLALAYWAMQVKGLAVGWLLDLGRASLLIYFVHQLVVLTLVKQALGVEVHGWALYVAMTVLLLVAMVFVGRGWTNMRDRLRRGSAAA